MRNRLLATDGLGEFVETVWRKPRHKADEIHVKAVMTGVCRSDIDMMTGNFPALPLHMQGHEGLGIVTNIGALVYDVKVGDYVATRGEPGYADYYNVKKQEYVKVPELHPKYILEPVACGINVIKQARKEITARCGPDSRLLLLGSGFLAWVAYHTLMIENYEMIEPGHWFQSKPTGDIMKYDAKYIQYYTTMDFRMSKLRYDLLTKYVQFDTICDFGLLLKT